MASWIFGSPKSNLPAVTALQTQRSKQIESLKSFNPNVVELKRDEEYRISFNSGSHHVSFTMYLPPEFPQVKPVITVSPALRHPLIDEQMQVVRYLPLVNFGVQTDFGRLVQSLIQEFNKFPHLIQPESTQQRNVPNVPQYQHFMPQPQPGAQPQQLPPLQQPHPPHHHPQHQTPPQQAPHVPLATTSGQSNNPFMPQMQAPPLSSSPSMSAAASSMSAATSSFPSEHPVPSSSSAALGAVNGMDVEPNLPVPGSLGTRGLDSHPYAMPNVPASFDQFLKNLTKAQLEELLEDEEKLDALFSQVPELAKMLKDRTELYQGCEEIAKLNMSYRPELDRLRRELEETVKFRNDVKNKFDMKCLQQQSLNEQYSIPNLLDNLRVSAADAEHQSEDLAERFLGNQVGLDEFLKNFSEQRKLLHIRRVKEEKLSQLIEASQQRY